MKLLHTMPGPPPGRRGLRWCRAPVAGHTGRSLALWLAVLAACSPTLNWREVRLAGSSVQLLMPCKPDSHERRLLLAGKPERLALHVCSAGDQTWSLAFADLGDPARLGDVMQQLLQAARANVSASGSTQAAALRVPGATPHDASQSQAFRGRLADGKAVQMQVAVFAHGTQVFQATALGPELPADGVHTFMDSIRFAR